MATQKESYTSEQEKQVAPESITMTNAQLKMMVTSIVEGMHSIYDNMQGASRPTPGSTTKNVTVLDKGARNGSVSRRPVRANFKNSKLIPTRISVAELNVADVKNTVV